MKPLLVTSGEPAGIGPDLCLDLIDSNVPVVVLADKAVLAKRAALLGRTIPLDDYVVNQSSPPKPGVLSVLSIPCPYEVSPGVLTSQNAPYVISMLSNAVDGCLAGSFSALVTTPVQKSVINEANIPFSGHTEFLAERCGVDTVVMMLVCDQMKVALVTTHLPLRQVPDAITSVLLNRILTCLDQSLKHDFGIAHPRIQVAGLNPHAGEGGYLGMEEIDIISPTLKALQQSGMDVLGPFSADTLFTESHRNACDVFVAMYHDQGLAVLKYASFGKAVNITLGLPIIRTSVDHGTALSLAGTGQADSGSLMQAVAIAAEMARTRARTHDH